MDKKILLISYHFPPSQAVGGLRVANFARYLPQSGWKPFVLTVQDKYIVNQDSQRLQDLENVTIYKTIKLPEVVKLYSVVKFFVGNIHVGKKGEKRGGAVASSPQISEEKPEALLQRLKRYYASLFLALPDYEKNWVLPGTLKAIKEIQRQKIDCILTSCPPYSVHLIGLLASMATGVKWIADFRDPWYVASKKRMYPTCTLSRKIESRLERAVIKRAVLVLCNTEKLRETLEQAYNTFPNNKFVYIPNGISTDIFQKLEQLQKYEKFTLTYTGSLYFFRTPEPIFKVLKKLIDEGKVGRDEVNIKLVGHCQAIDGYPTKDLVSSYGLDGIVDVVPPVSYQQSLEIVKRSHLALLFAPDQPYQIPAKVYDYMGTGTKILALAGEGATADMVRKTKTGEVFHPDNHDGVKVFLLEAITDRKPVEEKLTKQVMARFNREKVVNDLAAYMNEHLECSSI